jgi:carboxymethylenebutenolidase
METLTEDVTIGDRPAVLSRPAGAGRWPGVVMLHEIFGIDDVLRRQADRLASAGYLVLAPDLLGEGGRFGCMRRAFQALTARQGRPFEVISEARSWVAGQRECSGKVGVIGFCMGGGFVFALAARRPDLVSAAVPFYGLPRDDSVVPGIRAAVQGHFGLEDRGIPVERVRSVFEALDGRPGAAAAELHLYPAGHAFLNDENLIGTHDPESAALAWSRAVEFLTRHVR